VKGLKLMGRLPGGGVRNRTPRRLLIVAQLLAGLVLGVVLFDRLLMPLVVRQGAIATVPDLRGKARPDAEPALSEARLRLGNLVEVPDRAAKAGEILSQDPPPGAVVRRGRVVNLLVSSGAPVREIPDFAGRTVRSARLDLGQLGLRQGAILVLPSETVPEGQIVGTHPGRGALAKPDAVVDFLVSGGTRRSLYLMPDLRGRPIEEACAMLGAGGIVASPPDESRGAFVMEQSPPAGEAIASGERALLY